MAIDVGSFFGSSGPAGPGASEAAPATGGFLSSLNEVLGIAGPTFDFIKTGQETKAVAAFHLKNAEIAEFRGEQELRDLNRSRALLSGRQRAIFGKSNVVASSGSALNLSVDTARSFARAKVRSQFNTHVAVESAKYQAAVARYQGEQKQIQAVMKGITGLGSVIAGGGFF